MKVLPLCLAGIGLSLACTGYAANPSYGTFTGFSAGLGLGFRIVDNKASQVKSGSNGYTQNGDTTTTQSTQNLQFDYGYQFHNQMYLSAGGTAGIAQGNEKSSNNYGSSRISTLENDFKATYGLNAKLGYALSSRLLPYLTLGWQWMKEDYKTVDTNSGTTTADFSTNRFANGPMVGLGLRYKLMPHVLVGLEYNMAFYNKATSTKTVSGTSYTLSTHPQHVMTALLTLGYLF
ncbi:MAG: hypothetical protein COV52_02585 [Gammaproteobacteria bacterium CG11_big_fil_rev_8_21_14_0_20_46_22]|nr:MAG: hypothetical protein COW05_08625 [Gammaproteobacteria bacterium CG12_big_fil_rev_8_21_14_0_65_46_12]PIR11667.1 MAG: hypothetical protein COV52_02585 [Gammaproteobacteria bacterium CG11_big_fil_rev_8_21_14_0_20_46_22]